MRPGAETEKGQKNKQTVLGSSSINNQSKSSPCCMYHDYHLTIRRWDARGVDDARGAQEQGGR
jgi:hypothetical protein